MSHVMICLESTKTICPRVTYVLFLARPQASFSAGLTNFLSCIYTPVSAVLLSVTPVFTPLFPMRWLPILGLTAY